jgi:hypothetical protein
MWLVGHLWLVIHVYDIPYSKGMTIIVCDMQSKNTKVQQVMWTKLNDMMLRHGFPKPNSKGFMVEIA